MRLLLKRVLTSDKQTIGTLYLLDNYSAVIDSWFTLELPDLNNQRRISRIPEGIYKCKKHISPRFGQCLWLQDVPNRSEILIHRGNYHTDILGCILIGTDIKDINNDGYKDVVNSRNAIKYLMSYLEDVNGIMIEIV
jgi:hypothetical protein